MVADTSGAVNDGVAVSAPVRIIVGPLAVRVAGIVFESCPMYRIKQERGLMARVVKGAGTSFIAGRREGGNLSPQ